MTMVENVEILTLDLRFESYRIRNKRAQEELLVSISQNGIREPLEGVSKNNVRILLNGFKRYRCAQNLGIKILPYFCLGSDEARGIIELLRVSNAKTLTILEQARLIDQLKKVYKMPVSEIAAMLERSKAWVSMRIGILSQMSEKIRDQIFSGRFPAYSYMYTLRQFIRMNNIKIEEIERFVSSVSGKSLSIRQIEELAYGYFKGPDEYRDQIEEGNISVILERSKDINPETIDCNATERKMINSLDSAQKYMRQVIYKHNDTKLKNNAFFVQSNLLSGGILKLLDPFGKAIGELYDKSRKA
jgi:ParB/RepB/Spo0J family partition protein